MFSIKLLLKFLILFQCLGLASISILDGTSLGTYLFLYGGLAESLSYSLNYFISGLLMCIAALSLFKVWGPSLLLMALLFAIESFFKTMLGGSFASDLTLAAHLVRFAWPLLLGLVIIFDPSWQSLKRRDVLFFLKVMIAVTFFVHGIEALMMHPKFIDFIIVTNRKLGFLPATEAFARWSLYIIGAVDILAALGLVFKATRLTLIYMMVWGGLTAFIRFVYADIQGVPDVFLRAPHVGIPLLIWILGGFRVFKKSKKGSNEINRSSEAVKLA